jgi:spore coat polysaccharide biosynthesis predicted glycosyltransferase SpsG
MTAAARVAILTETGAGVGLGHLRRCQALAAALTATGAEPRLVVAGALPSGRATDAVPFDWLREPRGAAELLAAWRPAAAVVDSYAATTGFLAELGDTVARVAVIDDLADRELPVSLVVNGGYAAATLAYRVRPDTTLLLGPAYALLDPAFAVEPPRRRGAAVRRVLVTLGGDAPGERLDSVVAAVRAAVPEADVDVAVGPYAAGAVAEGRRVTAHRGLESLRPLMLAADLAVAGGGVTLYECLASATPVIGLCLADNQRPNVDALSRAGLILRDGPSLAEALERLVRDADLRAVLAARGRAVVDGAGAARIARAVVHAGLAAGVVRGA